MTVITAKWEDLLPQFYAFALGGRLGGSVSEDSVRGFSLGGSLHLLSCCFGTGPAERLIVAG